MEPPYAGKFRSIFMENLKDDFSLRSKPMLLRFNWLTLLANIFSLQFTDVSEYQPSSSYRESKSQFFPYIRVCPTTKMSSATVKPSIQFSSRKLPWLIRVLLSAGIGVDGASDGWFIIAGPFGGRQQFPRRAQHQTFINTTQELGKALTVPGRVGRNG